MLRIEEIVGAMDDEFRYALNALSDHELDHLAANPAALRRKRPVGVSQAEALAMIATIRQIRDRGHGSADHPAPAQQPRRTVRRPKKMGTATPPVADQQRDARQTPPVPISAPQLPAPPARLLLAAPRLPPASCPEIPDAVPPAATAPPPQQAALYRPRPWGWILAVFLLIAGMMAGLA